MMDDLHLRLPRSCLLLVLKEAQRKPPFLEVDVLNFAKARETIFTICFPLNFVVKCRLAYLQDVKLKPEGWQDRGSPGLMVVGLFWI